VFPACEACNSGSAHDEQVVAMLSRMSPDGEDGDQKAETTEIIRAVARNDPDLSMELWASEEDVRAFLRRRGVAVPASLPLPDVPVLTINGPLVVGCMATFARKLFTALHYKETGHIVPPEGGIGWRWVTNASPVDEQVPVDFVMLLGGRPAIERARRNLEDQFDYVWDGPDGGSRAAYFVTFRSSFALFGIVSMDVSTLPEPDEPHRMLHPLAPQY
jgi:hypothetical protein